MFDTCSFRASCRFQASLQLGVRCAGGAERAFTAQIDWATATNLVSLVLHGDTEIPFPTKVHNTSAPAW